MCREAATNRISAATRGPRSRISSDPTCETEPLLYLRATKHAIVTLQATGARHGITLLAHRSLYETHPQEMEAAGAWLRGRNVSLCPVPGKRNAPEQYHYAKLHLWELSAYDKVAFYDADHLFLDDPDALFDACSGWMCAHGPPEGQSVEPAGRHHFNAGFFVVRPNASLVPTILAAWLDCVDPSSAADFHDRRENKCVQHILSGVHGMSARFNKINTELDRGALGEPLGADTAVVHAKFWRMGCARIAAHWGTSSQRVGVQRCLVSPPLRQPSTTGPQQQCDEAVSQDMVSLTMSTDRRQAEQLESSARRWGWNLTVLNIDPTCLGHSGITLTKACTYARALATVSSRYTLLIDGHDTLLQASPRDALNVQRAIGEKLMIEDESRTKLSQSAYRKGIRWTAGARVTLEDGRLMERPATGRAGGQDPKINFDLGRACGKPGFKHNFGVVMGPTRLLATVMDRMLEVNSTSSEQRAIGQLALMQPSWCKHFELSESGVFWHVGFRAPNFGMPEPVPVLTVACGRHQYAPFGGVVPLAIHRTTVNAAQHRKTYDHMTKVLEAGPSELGPNLPRTTRPTPWTTAGEVPALASWRAMAGGEQVGGNCPASTRLDIGRAEADVQLLQLGDRRTYSRRSAFIATVEAYAAQQSYRLVQLEVEQFRKIFKPICIASAMRASRSHLLLFVDLDVIVERPLSVRALPMVDEPACELWAQTTSESVNSGLILLRPHSPMARSLVDAWKTTMHSQANYDQSYLQATLLQSRRTHCCNCTSASCCVPTASASSCLPTPSPVVGKKMFKRSNACFRDEMHVLGWAEGSRSWGGLCFWNRSQRVNPHDFSADPWRPCDWVHHVNQRHLRVFDRVLPVNEDAPLECVCCGRRRLECFWHFRAWWRSVPKDEYTSLLNLAKKQGFELLAWLTNRSSTIGAAKELALISSQNRSSHDQGVSAQTVASLMSLLAFVGRSNLSTAGGQEAVACGPLAPSADQTPGLAPPVGEVSERAAVRAAVRGNPCRPDQRRGRKPLLPAPQAAAPLASLPSAGVCPLRWASGTGPLVVSLTTVAARLHLVASQGARPCRNIAASSPGVCAAGSRPALPLPHTY